MGIITDGFGKLFNVLWSVVEWLFAGLIEIIQPIFDLLITMLTFTFQLTWALYYLLYMIGVLAVKLFFIMFEAGKILMSLIVGFWNTLGSLFYSPASSGGHGYSEVIGRLFQKLEVLQLDSIAYILSFSLWFITAVAAMKLISSIRVGGS